MEIQNNFLSVKKNKKIKQKDKEKLKLTINKPPDFKKLFSNPEKSPNKIEKERKFNIEVPIVIKIC